MNFLINFFWVLFYFAVPALADGLRKNDDDEEDNENRSRIEV